jgi:hypothetical protein
MDLVQMTDRNRDRYKFTIRAHGVYPGAQVVDITLDGQLIATVNAMDDDDGNPLIKVLSHVFVDVEVDDAVPPPSVLIKLRKFRQ